MATWQELKGSPQLKISSKNPTGTAKYIVLGIATDAGMDEAVRLETPGSLLGMSRLDYSADHQGGGVWYVDVMYGISADGSTLGSEPLAEQMIPQPPGTFPGQGNEAGEPPPTESNPSQSADSNQPIGPEYSFDFTGGTQHITQSKATVHRVIRGGGPFAPNHKGAIGVSGDKVEGVDIVARKFNFTYTAKFKFITLNYLKTLSDLTGTWNDATFFGFEVGEVLFMGATGSFSGGQWSITYQFGRSPNKENVFICEGLEVPSKLGWDYLWVDYEMDVQGTLPCTVPRCAYVEQVYDPADLSQLGI